jgi:signal transduction histidine kinase
VDATVEHDTVRITVEDDGPGIDPAFLPYVFEPFRQADGSPRRAHDGLGLGLSIARHLVELHAGTMEAANGPRGGAVLTVVLPATAAVHASPRLSSD